MLPLALLGARLAPQPALGFRWVAAAGMWGRISGGEWWPWVWSPVWAWLSGVAGTQEMAANPCTET